LILLLLHFCLFRHFIDLEIAETGRRLGQTRPAAEEDHHNMAR